jgi:hypothetical protein
MKAAIRRVSLASLARTGCLMGVVAAFLPSLLCGLAALALAGVLRGWLESWQTLTITVLGQDIASFDLVQFLNLGGLQQFLHTLGSLSFGLLALLVLALALLTGLALALIVSLVGLAYNLLASVTGGLVVELQDARTSEHTG